MALLSRCLPPYHMNSTLGLLRHHSSQQARIIECIQQHIWPMAGKFFLRVMSGCHCNNLRTNGSCTRNVQRRIAQHPGTFRLQLLLMFRLGGLPGSTGNIISRQNTIAEATEAEVVVDAEVPQLHCRTTANITWLKASHYTHLPPLYPIVLSDEHRERADELGEAGV